MEFQGINEIVIMMIVITNIFQEFTGLDTVLCALQAFLFNFLFGNNFRFTEKLQR